ncbi:importin beta family [Trichomonas vaginalis G3]|uniref:importin beta family n=1 Tax=Trichomonas vaginalis (strain ATCC PRA-98 / G3) TaxID=412133 RepID=UPI0021E5BC50|nr:importin beta family [Trichomonas vaginalis G3]KAI5491769.1 importin beta family [Trichomonas vaginalis G3]
MDDAAEFLKKTIETTPWNEIFIYANKIIQDPTKSQVGLHIWNEIYQFYTSDDSRQALFHIFTICNEILTSSTHPDDQNEALNFLQFHLVRIEEYLSEEEKNIGEQIITTVQNEIHSNLYSNHNEQELNSYIRIVCNLVAESPEFIQESKSDFLQIAISACSDDSIPIKLRISMHNIIEAFAEIIALENREEIPMIINNSCNLAIEACRNDLDYNFPLSFFYGLSKSFSDDAEELFQIFMQIVQELTTNDDGDELMKTCCKKVSLLILRSISEGFQKLLQKT